MSPWRILALAPSAAGIALCLWLLSAGAPAVAAQDFTTAGRVSAALSVQNAASVPVPNPVLQRARQARRLAAMAAAEQGADRRQHREARADRQQAEAAAQQRAIAGQLPPAPSQPVASGNVMVMPGGFEGCVIQRESGGSPTAYNSSSGASGLFGFLLSTWMATPYGASYPGGAYTAPASVQEQAFAWVFARDGVAPWRPYDGC